MSKDFIVFFEGGEGSSAIMSHLKQFTEKLDIIWFEPFDNCHFTNKLIDDDLSNIFSNIFNKNIKKNYNENIRQIYSNYTDRQLADFDKNKSVGFKMRFRDWDTIKPIIIKNNVVIFLLVRKNIVKWAISKYGSNSLQFKLIKGEIKENPKTNINIKQFEKILKRCRESIDYKYSLFKKLKMEGVEVYLIYYEDYCENKTIFLNSILRKININLDLEKVKEIATKNIHFKKVHSDDIKTFVTNYDEFYKFIADNDLLEYI